MHTIYEDRFARHQLIPGFSQELVSALSIGVVGAGAIGNEVIKNLLLMGVGRIDVYDFDTVELSNLTRSVFLRESDIGMNKAQALINRATELNPTTRMRAFSGAIGRTLSIKQFSSYAVVIAAVDNIEARLRINDIALVSNTPWINAAIDSRNVVVELFPPNSLNQQNPPTRHSSVACYACNLPDSAFERLALRYSCGGLQRAAFLTRTIPTTAITASTAGALVCSELLRYFHAARPATPNVALLGEYKTEVAQRVFFDTAAPSSSRSQLSRAPHERGCPGCGLHQASEVVDGSHLNASQLFEQLQLSPNQNIELSDALIVDCHCLQCGATSNNNAELKALSGTRAREHTDAILRCPKCTNETVSIDIRESLSFDDYAQHFSAQIPDCAWLIQGQSCIDLLSSNPDVSS
jgi:molybdopterin-synthase adenylyltransferase